MSVRNLSEFILLAALWGGSFIFMRLSGPELGVFPGMALRTALAALALLPLLALRGLLAQLHRHAGKVLLIGMINSAIPFALYGYATLHLSAGFSAILNATVPFWGALVTWLWLGERPRISQLLGLVIGFAGVVMLVWGRIDLRVGGDGWPILACLLATLLYAVSASAMRKYLSEVPPLVSATGSQIGATLLLAPLALLQWPSATPSLTAMASVVVLAVVCTAFAYVLYFRLMAHVGPVRATTVTFLIPVFGMLWGALFLAERITVQMVLATGVILLGTALTTGVLKLRPAH